MLRRATISFGVFRRRQHALPRSGVKIFQARGFGDSRHIGDRAHPPIGALTKALHASNQPKLTRKMRYIAIVVVNFIVGYSCGRSGFMMFFLQA
jgi:hypothetical protein